MLLANSDLFWRKRWLTFVFPISISELQSTEWKFTVTEQYGIAAGTKEWSLAVIGRYQRYNGRGNKERGTSYVLKLACFYKNAPLYYDNLFYCYKLILSML